MCDASSAADFKHDVLSRVAKKVVCLLLYVATRSCSSHRASTSDSSQKRETHFQDLRLLDAEKDLDIASKDSVAFAHSIPK